MHRPDRAVAVSEACVPNIGPRGRRRRLRAGLAWLAIALAGSAWAVVARAPWAWLAPLSGAWLLAAIGWFQAREKT